MHAEGRYLHTEQMLQMLQLVNSKPKKNGEHNKSIQACSGLPDATRMYYNKTPKQLKDPVIIGSKH